MAGVFDEWNYWGTDTYRSSGYPTDKIPLGFPPGHQECPEKVVPSPLASFHYLKLSETKNCQVFKKIPLSTQLNQNQEVNWSYQTKIIKWLHQTKFITITTWRDDFTIYNDYGEELSKNYQRIQKQIKMLNKLSFLQMSSSYRQKSTSCLYLTVSEKQQSIARKINTFSFPHHLVNTQTAVRHSGWLLLRCALATSTCVRMDGGCP